MMDTNNIKISARQFGILTNLVTPSLFIGSGFTILFSLLKQDAWFTVILSFFTVFIPLLIFIYIVNYEPDKNILEKNKLLFGKIFGNIINFILTIYIFGLGIYMTWSISHFAITKYLNRAPRFFIALFIIIPVIYAVIKGIESIARTSEVMFFIAYLFIIVITFSLLKYTDFIRLKPYFINGIIPIFKYNLHFISYFFTPLLTLLIIPKKNIVDEKNYHKYLIGGIILSLIVLLIGFSFIIATIGIELAQLYRYPEYYILKKINIGDVLDNVENILSLHWFFNMFTLLMLCMYFVKKYIEDLFNIKQQKILNIIPIITGLIFCYVCTQLFSSVPLSLTFIKNYFPYLVFLVLFALLIIICIFIFFKKIKTLKLKA